MSAPDGWQPLSKPARRTGADAFHLSPFARLARAHAFTSVGDALVTIALAGSLFFDIDPNSARWKVFLYLGLTVAPLALVAPFIGPALDRSHGGRRWMVVGVNTVRVFVCLLLIKDINSLVLFPEAFVVLAMGKAYAVALRALVPTVVRNDDELVEANSKLQLLSGLAAPGAGALSAPAYAIGGPQGVLCLAVVAYAVGAIASLRIPSTQVAPQPATAEEAAELRSVGIFLAASAMALVRGIVGFLTFLLLFGLREEPKWHLGIVLGCTGGGALIGAALAPRLRTAVSLERMLETVLGLTVVVAAGAAWFGVGDSRVAASAVLAGTVAIVSTCGKLAFDSLVQRDAPDANRGRSFARFEVRFQMAWVIGAMIPILLLPILHARLGFVVIAGTAAFALVSYLAGQRSAHRSHAAGPVGAAVVRPDPTLAIYDGEDEGDFAAPTAPASWRAPGQDPGDLASWQISEPSWGPDATTVDPERTRVQGYPVDPTELR